MFWHIVRQLVYEVCYTRYYVLFYLRLIESLLKHCKAPEYYEQDCKCVYYLFINLNMRYYIFMLLYIYLLIYLFVLEAIDLLSLASVIIITIVIIVCVISIILCFFYSSVFISLPITAIIIITIIIIIIIIIIITIKTKYLFHSIIKLDRL